MGYSPSYRLLPGLIACSCLLGCGATTRMQPGVPLEVERGYCFLVRTTFKQRGRPVSTRDTLNQLERYAASGPQVRDGRALDVAALAGAIAGSSTVFVGDMGRQGLIEMSEGESTALIAGGLGVAVAGWLLCVASDGKYAEAAAAYNAHVPWTEDDSGDDRASETAEDTE